MTGPWQISPTSARVLGAVLCAALLAACGSSGSPASGKSGKGTARIARSMLSAVPCITDGIRTTFGSAPDTDHSYGRDLGVGKEHYKLRYIVRPDPAVTGVAEDRGKRIIYEIFHRGPNETGVVYEVDVPGGGVAEWLAQAGIPLEQCGAVLGRK